MHLKCYRLVATTTATTTTSTMMRITLMGSRRRSRSMMKPIHSLMFNQLTHGNNNNSKHRHRRRHKLINNNRNYISALRRRMKHTFRVLWVCRSLGQSVSQSSLPVATHTYFLCNRSSAQSLVALALLLALLLSRLARYLSRIFAYIFHEVAPDRQAGTVRSTLSRLIIVIFLEVAVICIALYIQLVLRFV